MPANKNHTPGPMRPLTAIEVAANAAARWRKQYEHWADADHFFDGTTKGQVNDALNRCAHTPENIAKAINDGWAYPQCESCGEYRHAVVEMARPYSDDEHLLCLPCLEAAVNLLKQIPKARDALAKESK
jgi:hypothetical protein